MSTLLTLLGRAWKWLTAESLPATTGRTVDYTHSMWGHTIHRWDSRDAGRWFVMGHGPLVGGDLRSGDVIASRMESGRVGRYIVLEARYFSDPSDMFRAIVAWLGYEDPK